MKPGWFAHPVQSALIAGTWLLLQQSAAVSNRLVPTQVDLSSLAGLRALADGISQPVDVLVNNVGVLLNQFALTDEGIERSFATNLLGHYVLTEALHARGGLAANAASTAALSL